MKWKEAIKKIAGGTFNTFYQHSRVCHRCGDHLNCLLTTKELEEFRTWILA